VVRGHGRRHPPPAGSPPTRPSTSTPYTRPKHSGPTGNSPGQLNIEDILSDGEILGGTVDPDDMGETTG
jgi:hypothetical protein